MSWHFCWLCCVTVRLSLVLHNHKCRTVVIPYYQGILHQVISLRPGARAATCNASGMTHVVPSCHGSCRMPYCHGRTCTYLATCTSAATVCTLCMCPGPRDHGGVREGLHRFRDAHGPAVGLPHGKEEVKGARAKPWPVSIPLQIDRPCHYPPTVQCTLCLIGWAALAIPGAQ